MLTWKKFLVAIIALIVLSLIYIVLPKPATPTPHNDDDAVFCTMDAFECADGTWVGRTGPNCEFVCPSVE